MARDVLNEILAEAEEGIKRKPSVAYARSLEGFILYTTEAEALKILGADRVGFQYIPRQQLFMAQVKKLPRSKEIELYEHKITPPAPGQHQKLERQYDRYLKMIAVQEKMAREISKMEDTILDTLVQHGMKLKPGSPRDAQLLMRDHDTRLHHRQSIRKEVNQEMVEHFLEDFPELKICIRTRKIQEIDRDALEQVMTKLPQYVARRLMQLVTYFSFDQRPLNKPQCQYCGGKVLKKTKRCNRCGLETQYE
jgi:hypothetical protein